MMVKSGYIHLVIILLVLMSACRGRGELNRQNKHLQKALANSKEAQEGFNRCYQFTKDWLETADPVSGLIPENLTAGRDRWTPHNSGADNYPFMVLTAALLDSTLLQQTLYPILINETKLTSRIKSIPDAYGFSTQGFTHDSVDLERLIFGGSEYVKDGLLPLTEYLGPSPWSERMTSIIDDIWSVAPLETKAGNLPSFNVEINGEQMQTLSRLYWMTGERKYLDWAIRLGDYYLLHGPHPTDAMHSLRLRDHGCEIVSGLCEVYATVAYAMPQKREAYRDPIYRMLNRILEVGTNADGLFYNVIDPVSGQILDSAVADTWGYTYNGYLTVYQLDSIPAYRNAVHQALKNIGKYRQYNWENYSADGYADAIESGLNLYHRIPVSETRNWLESEIRNLWNLQDDPLQERAQAYRNTGVIEGWHGDGNFARTTLMYCLWKTQGITLHPWRTDLAWGAVQHDDTLFLAVQSERPWRGRVYFDIPRHSQNLHLPWDWPRINQFPEWFTVRPNETYQIQTGSDKASITSAKEMQQGISIEISDGKEFMTVQIVR